MRCSSLPEFDILEKRVNFKGKTGSVCFTIKLSHACAGESDPEEGETRDAVDVFGCVLEGFGDDQIYSSS